MWACCQCPTTVLTTILHQHNEQGTNSSPTNTQSCRLLPAAQPHTPAPPPRLSARDVPPHISHILHLSYTVLRLACLARNTTYGT